jgi:hypothetical protein
MLWNPDVCLVDEMGCDVTYQGEQTRNARIMYQCLEKPSGPFSEPLTLLFLCFGLYQPPVEFFKKSLTNRKTEPLCLHGIALSAGSNTTGIFPSLPEEDGRSL